MSNANFTYYLAPRPQLEYPAGPGDDQLDLVPGGGGDEGHGQAAVELRRPRLVNLRVERVDRDPVDLLFGELSYYVTHWIIASFSSAIHLSHERASPLIVEKA